MSTATIADEIDKLQEDLPTLALNAHERKPGAQAILDKTRARIRELAEAREIAALVEQGRERQAMQQAEAQQAARRRDAEARRDSAVANKRALAPEFDRAVDGLLAVIARLKEAGRDEYVAVRDMGLMPNRKVLMSDALAGVLGWRLSQALEGHVDRPHPYYRRSLTDLLSGANAAPTMSERLAAIQEHDHE